jgi:biotin-dependent carboxylase-like uncharacterized protein
VALEALDSGFLTTVQDAGRPAAGHLGVPRGGAADTWSHAAANALLGNEAGAAALELTIVGPALRVVAPLTIALAGADLGGIAETDSGQVAMAPGRTHALAAGTTLRFAGPVDGETGCRAYVALPGGIDVPEVLGSRSTALASGFGGLEGRPLGSGDVIRPLADRPRANGLPHTNAAWPGSATHPLAARGAVVRVLPGPDRGSAPGALDALCGVVWRIRSDSDRMGLRLEGPPIAGGSNDRLTAPTTWGAIQLPAGGGPIILLADGQPTGGYPVFAVAITADHPILGQLPPGARVRFEAVSMATAHDALAAQRRDLAEARRAIGLATGWDDLWLDAGA